MQEGNTIRLLYILMGVLLFAIVLFGCYDRIPEVWYPNIDNTNAAALPRY